MLKFDVNGIKAETFTDIEQRLIQALKNIYGQDIDLSQNTPDGQRIGIFIKEVMDLQAFAVQLYANMDADLATGTALDILLKFTGITRQAATRSYADVEIQTDRELVLPAGFIVLDDTEQEWITTQDYNLVKGSNTVTLFAKQWGKIEAGASTITKQSTFINGVLSVNNPDPAIAGRNEETDEQLRIRRAKILEIAGYSTAGSALSQILNINGVTDGVVYENYTHEYDAEKDMQPHSIWFVIEGGDIDKIIEVIGRTKTMGTGIKGNVVGQYIEVVPRNNGNDFSIVHEMRFDRPTYIELKIKLNAKRKITTQPLDLDLIKNQIASKTFTIGEDLEASELYSLGYEAGKNFTLYGLQISKDGGSTFTDENLQSGYDNTFVIKTENIEISEIF